MLLSNAAFGQADTTTSCDAKEISKLERQFKKADRISEHGGAEVAYALSTCYKGANDSLRRAWLTTAIDRRKKFYPDLRMSEKVGMIRDVGLWYGELGERILAEQWTLKWTKAECESPDAYYHHGKSLLALGRNAEARIDLETALRKGSTAADLDQLLQIPAIDAAAFTELIGIWYLTKFWSDSTLVFDAANEQSTIDRLLKKRRPFGGASDSAASVEEAHQKFMQAKEFSIEIHADSSLSRTGMGGDGPSEVRDHGHVDIEHGRWTMIGNGAHDRTPFEITTEGLVILDPENGLIQLLFRRRE